jgi:hypothetical protein
MEMALVVVVVLLTAQVFALDDDVGLPIHPKAIASSIVRQSGKGEGTEWVQVNFKTNAPYEQVVRFYREKTGRNVNVSQLDSGKLLNTLILYVKKPQDQININISSEVGEKVTQVEISRNRVPQ